MEDEDLNHYKQTIFLNETTSKNSRKTEQLRRKRLFALALKDHPIAKAILIKMGVTALWDGEKLKTL